MNKKNLIISFLLILACNTLIIAQKITVTQNQSKIQKRAYQSAKAFIAIPLIKQVKNYTARGKLKIDTIVIDENEKSIHLYLNKFFSEAPLRSELVNQLYSAFNAQLPRTLKKYKTKIFSANIELKDYIPNYYRNSFTNVDSSRLNQAKNLRPERKNFVKSIKPYHPTNGLSNSNIALWGSHGFYYESSLDRWQWQRARLFTTVEDLSPTSFVIPFLIPMLNNSGAYVLTPREQDIQTNEIIIDNDLENKLTKYPEFLRKTESRTGYSYTEKIEGNENPFRQGTYLYGTSTASDSVEWMPDFPESGDYMVYIAYGSVKNASQLKYRVYYDGGHHDYQVDQKMGYGTWIPLGINHLIKGISNRLVLYIEKGQSVSVDAVRFGGGFGNVYRNGRSSGKPRFMEGTRYYLQYSGFPDSLVWKQSGENKDYLDNYRSMGDWINYLIGKPFGPPKDTTAGLGISIDCSIAFHTDAGILGGDSVIGTLGIYSTDKNNGIFADGQSRYASRDFTDIVQSQIVDDIRLKYNKNWTRRGMWNSEYSEAYKPNVPAMLLELLSHQSPNEMKLALDPNFRFDVSRAIYKGILKFISFQNGYDYVVQPLPVNHMKIELIDMQQIKLSWRAVIDSIEPTAKAEKFIVYTRIGNSGFDQGKVVESNELIINNINKNTIYSFKVTALNNGGESFPSEILSMGISENIEKPILIVNGFDRLEGPEFVENKSFTGFMRNLDQGVPYLYDFNTTGDQHDFDPKSPWKDDDCPGFGASYADQENTIYPGNTFDFPYIHGTAMLNNGYSFISISDEAYLNSSTKYQDYLMVDFLFGEEKTKAKCSTKYKIFTNEFIKALNNLTENKIPVFISGSYIGTEIGNDTIVKKEIGKLLGYKFGTDHAVKNGDIYVNEKNATFPAQFKFVTKYDKAIYPAESTDAIEPYNQGSKVILRYTENNLGAGVFGNNLNRTIALGFPFECLSNSMDRDKMMELIIQKLIKK